MNSKEEIIKDLPIKHSIETDSVWKINFNKV